jgi:hypothetical protein
MKQLATTSQFGQVLGLNAIEVGWRNAVKRKQAHFRHDGCPAALEATPLKVYAIDPKILKLHRIAKVGSLNSRLRTAWAVGSLSCRLRRFYQVIAFIDVLNIDRDNGRVKHHG